MSQPEYIDVRLDLPRRTYLCTGSDGTAWEMTWDEARRMAEDLARWCGFLVPGAYQFEANVEGMKTLNLIYGFAKQYAERTGRQCLVDLHPELIGHEGRRLRITYPDGSRLEGWLGRSLGWLPHHLLYPNVGAGREDAVLIRSGFEAFEVLQHARRRYGSRNER